MADDGRKRKDGDSLEPTTNAKQSKTEATSIPSTSQAVETPVAPKPDASEKPISKPITDKPLKETKVSMTIKNSSILKPFSQAAAAPKQPRQPRPSGPNTDWFRQLNVPSKIEYDDGSRWIVDVQPDLRFPFAYVWYNVVHKYPGLDIKGYPMVSSLSLIAYNMILFSAHHYFMDRYFRPTSSLYSNNFHRDLAARDFANCLLQCKVPQFMETLLSQVAATQDPARHGLAFVPSFAGFSWPHDFGRTVPAAIFIAAHNKLARTKTNPDVDQVMKDIYNTVIVQIDNYDYRVTHFLGGPYYHGPNAGAQHRNWISDKFEAIVNPVINRVLTQRPTLACINLLTPIWHADTVNPYEFLLCYHEDNSTVMTEFINAVSNYLDDTEPNGRTVGEILADTTGLAVLSHSIESPTLPTWHRLPLSESSAITFISSSSFATKINFLTSPPLGKGKFNIPKEGTYEAKFYLVREEKMTEASRAVKYVEFDRKWHVQPTCLWMQPYTRQPNVLDYSLTLGYKIETGELDGVCIPIPNLRNCLRDNNSQFIQGSIPISAIKAVVNTGEDRDQTRVIRRSTHEESSCGIAVRDMSRNVLPLFANEDVNNALLLGFHEERHHDDPAYAATYSGWRHGEVPRIDEGSIYLWSSYRYVENAHTMRKKVFLYFTLRAMYGLGTPLSRTSNPATLLPG